MLHNPVVTGVLALIFYQLNVYPYKNVLHVVYNIKNVNINSHYIIDHTKDASQALPCGLSVSADKSKEFSEH